MANLARQNIGFYTSNGSTSIWQQRFGPRPSFNDFYLQKTIEYVIISNRSMLRSIFHISMIYSRNVIVRIVTTDGLNCYFCEFFDERHRDNRTLTADRGFLYDQTVFTVFKNISFKLLISSQSCSYCIGMSCSEVFCQYI